MGFWEYCFNKRLEHYYFFFIYTCFLQFVYARIGVIVGEDSLLWRVSSQCHKSKFKKNLYSKFRFVTENVEKHMVNLVPRSSTVRQKGSPVLTRTKSCTSTSEIWVRNLQMVPRKSTTPRDFVDRLISQN